MLDLLIITGASRGIGASIVKKCAPICKNMIVIGSSNDIKNIISNECNIIPLQLDLKDWAYCKHQVMECIKNLEIIKNLGIVLCGAQLGEPGGLLNSDLDNWESTYNCNVIGNLSVVQACGEIIKSGAKTRIAFFAGGGAAFGYPIFFGYSLSKVAVVRAVENLGLELADAGYDASVIAIAPGAVATDTLAKVIASGAEVRTKTDISEPTNFVYKFLIDEFPAKEINGKFLHVRDDISKVNSRKDIFNLRRIQ